MLYDFTKKKQIIKNTKLADTEIKQGIGLMFSRKSKFNYCLIFPRPRSSVIGSTIHMMFVFYPIKVIFLDENKRVVDIKKANPFFFYSPKKPSKYILELPIKTNTSFVRINDKLEWK